MISRKILIKNLSLGFLPVLIFIVADEIFGLTVGLIVAIFSGIGETIFTYIQEKRLDRFILFDTALIVLLGLTSLTLHNDLFFKLKPGLVEFILVILLGITGFSQNPLLIKMTGRYMKGIEFSTIQVQQMQALMRRLFFVIVLHTGLIFYSAFFMSTRAWGFISGGLFYIVLGTLMVVEFVRARMQRRKLVRKLSREEWFDLVTPQGQIIGRAPRSEVHGNPELLHPVVHVHIVNSKGELFLQKRAPSKDLYPGKWDTAVGGHVMSGETIAHALNREAEEELGISMATFQPLFRYVHKNNYESELVHGFLLKDEGPFFPNRKEIAEGRFWKAEEIEARLNTGIFTPNFEEEFNLLKKYVFPRLKAQP